VRDTSTAITLSHWYTTDSSNPKAMVSAPLIDELREM
jgi:hypothetical protein